MKENKDNRPYDHFSNTCGSISRHKQVFMFCRFQLRLCSFDRISNLHYTFTTHFSKTAPPRPLKRIWRNSAKPPRCPMCSAALKKNDIKPGKIKRVRSAAGSIGPKLKPKSKAHSNKSGMLQNRGPDRVVGVRANRDENRFVTRIHGKWAFSILSRLQDGPTDLSELRSALPQTSRKNLKRYLRELEKAGLIVLVDRSRKTPQAGYVLSDPLGISAVHLMNALVQSIDEVPEPKPQDRA